MRAAPIQFERLLIRLRRRWMLRRLLDGFVLGLAAGCAVALVGFGAAWWLGGQQLRPAWVIAILAVASGLGTALNARRRPSLAQVALKADRALATGELFSSALFARSIAVQNSRTGAGAADRWAAAVIAQAQRRAADLAPPEFRRHGRPALLTIFGPGIGARTRVAVFLFAGAVVTVAASLPTGRDVSPGVAPSEASTVIAPAPLDGGSDSPAGAVLRVAVAMPPVPVGAAPVGAALTDDLATRMDRPQQNSLSPAQDAAAESNPTKVAQADIGNGAGESRTPDASGVSPPPADPGAADPRAADPRAFDRSGRTASGGGPSDPVTAITPSLPGSFSPANAGPPSATAHKNADRSSPRLIANPFAAASGDQSPPDADRDLLRDFFSPSVPNVPNGSP